MDIFLYILYVFIIFATHTNIYFKCSDNLFFAKSKNILAAIFSFAFALSCVNDFAFYKLFYFLIILGFSTFVFALSLMILWFKTKDIYNGFLSKVIWIWEIITFVPIFLTSVYLWFLKLYEINVQFILLFIIAFAFFYKAVIGAVNTPKVKHVNIFSDKIISPLSVVLLADIHLKKNLSKDFLQGIIKQTNELNPDMILIAGDLIDTSIKNINYLELLNDFSSKYGTFYVLGNHEYYHGVEQIHKKLKEYNLTILDNKIQNFDSFSISGTNDLMGLKYKNFKPDLSPIKPHLNASKFNILLTHQPKFVKKYDVSDFDLVLCGHTHAGQIFPFSLAVKLEQGFLNGLYKLDKTLMYVSSGAGFWGMSARFFAPSEITHINISPKN